MILLAGCRFVEGRWCACLLYLYSNSTGKWATSSLGSEVISLFEARKTGQLSFKISFALFSHLTWVNMQTSFIPRSEDEIRPEKFHTDDVWSARRYLLGCYLKVFSNSLDRRSQVAYHCRRGFCSMKRLGVLLLPLDGMLVHRRIPPSIFVRLPWKFAGTHLYSWVERGTVRVTCLVQEHNTITQASNPTR